MNLKALFQKVLVSKFKEDKVPKDKTPLSLFIESCTAVKNAETLFNMLAAGLIPEELYPQLVSKQSIIGQYILYILKDGKQKAALDAAVNPEHRLGAFFYISDTAQNQNIDTFKKTLDNLSDTQATQLIDNTVDDLIIALLKKPIDVEDETLGILVAWAGSEKAAKNLIDLLQQIRQRQNGVKECLDIIKQKDNMGYSILTILTQWQTSSTCQKFLSLLDDLRKQQDCNASDVLEVLGLQSKNGDTIGHWIVYEQDKETCQQFLTLLDNLRKQKDCNAGDVLKVLELQDEQKCTIGYRIAQKQDKETCQQFLTLLDDLGKQKDCNTSDILKILKLESGSGATIGHWIAYKQDKETCQQFLTLLDDLRKQQDCNASDVLEVLGLQSKNVTTGHWIAYKQDKQTCQQFLTLLTTLSQTLPPNSSAEEMKMPNETLKHIFEDTTLFQKFATIKGLEAELVALLNCNINLEDAVFKQLNDNKKLENLKKRLFEYIEKLDNSNEKLQLINNALDKNHALGKIFWYRRKTGFFSKAPNATNGYRGKLSDIQARLKHELSNTNTHCPSFFGSNNNNEQANQGNDVELHERQNEPAQPATHNGNTI